VSKAISGRDASGTRCQRGNAWGNKQQWEADGGQVDIKGRAHGGINGKMKGGQRNDKGIVLSLFYCY
jgi:hypothetical protein